MIELLGTFIICALVVGAVVYLVFRLSRGSSGQLPAGSPAQVLSDREIEVRLGRTGTGLPWIREFRGSPQDLLRLMHDPAFGMTATSSQAAVPSPTQPPLTPALPPASSQATPPPHSVAAPPAAGSGTAQPAAAPDPDAGTEPGAVRQV
jgi:hypothetical protein